MKLLQSLHFSVGGRPDKGEFNLLDFFIQLLNRCSFRIMKNILDELPDIPRHVIKVYLNIIASAPDEHYTMRVKERASEYLSVYKDDYDGPNDYGKVLSKFYINIII